MDPHPPPQPLPSNAAFNDNNNNNNGQYSYPSWLNNNNRSDSSGSYYSSGGPSSSLILDILHSHPTILLLLPHITYTLLLLLLSLIVLTTNLKLRLVALFSGILFFLNNCLVIKDPSRRDDDNGDEVRINSNNVEVECFYSLGTLGVVLFLLILLGAKSSILWVIGRVRRVKGGKMQELEMVYRSLFLPLRLPRRQFHQVISVSKSLRTLGVGDTYAKEKVTRVEWLGLLLKGRLLVSQSSRPLHTIGPLQFIDSPEYFGVATDDLFQVTITAVEESRLLLWHRDKLRLCIQEDEYLRQVWDHVVGKDVVGKLVQVSDGTNTGGGPGGGGGPPNNHVSSSSMTGGMNHSNNTSKGNGKGDQIEIEPLVLNGNGGLGGGGGLEHDQDNGGMMEQEEEIWSLTKIAEEQEATSV